MAVLINVCCLFQVLIWPPSRPCILLLVSFDPHDIGVQFSLIVDNFGVKYVGKRHMEHLINALKKHYTKLTVDWNGALYAGITLDWNY